MKAFINEHNRVQFKYARSLTAHYAKSFYFSAALLPKTKRWATYALYGFCRYVDNLIDTPRSRSREEIIAEITYLEEELRTAFRTGESEHPIIKPFISVAKYYNLDSQYASELIAGVRMDVNQKRYQTFDDLYLFAYRVAGVVGLMMTPLLGSSNKDAFPLAEKLGIAMQLTNILRDIKEDKDMDRIYIPQEEMRIFGISEEDFFQERMTPKFREMMKFQVDRAHEYYREADKGIKMLDRDAQFAIYSASKIYRGILSKIELRDYNPFLGRVFIPQAKKVRIVASEALKTKALSVAGLLTKL